MTKRGLHYKLIRAFLLQIALISIVTLLGIHLSGAIAEKLLVKEALVGEANHFWRLYRNNPKSPLPNTLNLTGYLAIGEDFSNVPEELKDTLPGYSRVPFNGRQPLLHVEDRGNKRLFLVFDEESVSKLAFYFGIFPLSLVLLLLYLLAWLSYRASTKAVSPIVELAEAVETFNFKEQSLAQFDLKQFRAKADDEVTKLVDALMNFTERLNQFIEREQNFTRDASHELRTPLAVIKASASLLQKRKDFKPNEIQALTRIDKTIKEMESLIETLLLLAREEGAPLPDEDILMNDLLAELVDQVSRAVNNKSITLAIEESCMLTVKAPERVLSILFTNLLRNAFSYTQEGKVLVMIRPREVSIIDSGEGMNQTELQCAFKPFYRGQRDKAGYGLGLTIVKRLCGRFGWTVRVSSKPGEGTSVTVLFPNQGTSVIEDWH